MLGQKPPGPLPVQGPLSRFVRPTARTTTRVLAVAWLVGGCSTGADVAGLATQDEVLRLRTDVTSLQRSIQQARAQTESLSNQLAARPQPQAVDPTRQLEALNQRLDNVAGTLANLNRRIDDLTGRVDVLGRQVRASATIRPTPGGPPTPPPTAGPATAAPATAAPATAAPATPAPATASPAISTPATPAPVTASPAPSTPATPAPPAAALAAPPPTAAPATATPAAGATRAATATLAPHDLYQASYIDFSKGSYTLAIDGFREFLRRYPDHAQASNAQYWIGESYAALAQQHANAGQADRATESLQRAVVEFRKVIANYPRGDRAPTALYKEALTLLDLKQPTLAQARLQYLIDNFPQAEEIPQARERLSALKK
jgi:TolA-binding protein